jgi:AraC-like DNA-binding protein
MCRELSYAGRGGFHAKYQATAHGWPPVHHDNRAIIAGVAKRPVQQNLHLQRISAVTAHVRENLAGDLSLATLGLVAGFSPFHFHRVFKSLTDETVNDVALRLHLERVTALLRATPALSIIGVAFECDFQSLAVFSRAFKVITSAGLFQGMFDKNTMTFNPGWDQKAKPRDAFTNVRDLQPRLRAQGVVFLTEADEATTGPASFVMSDPDGNPILIDQHR